MKDLFKQAVMDTVYPVLHIAALPSYQPGDYDNVQVKHTIFDICMLDQSLFLYSCFLFDLVIFISCKGHSP